jgi:hypothetical protein
MDGRCDGGKTKHTKPLSYLYGVRVRHARRGAWRVALKSPPPRVDGALSFISL